MQKHEQLFIDLPTASVCLTQHFPVDPKANIAIVYHNKVYSLQVGVLKSFSQYFASVLTDNMPHFQIKAPLNQQALDNVLSIIYGNAVGIDRSDVPEYYKVAKFLQIQHLLTVLQNDMLEYFEEYDTFAVMKLAHDDNNDQLFKKCIEQLEQQAFQQMKYHQLSLLNIDLVLFKLIIKSHNSFKGHSKKGLSYRSIEELIKLYSDANNLPNNQCDSLKVELIEVSVLSAMEYKQIFLDPAVKSLAQYQETKDSNEAEESDARFKKKMSILLYGFRAPNSGQEVRELKLYLENIFLRKIAQELDKQQQKANQELKQLRELKELKDPKSNNRKKSKTITMDEFINQKNGVKQEVKHKKLNEFFSVIDKMNEEFEGKLDQINQIVTTYERKKKLKIQRMNTKSQLSEFGSSSFSSGVYLSCEAIHQMMASKGSLPMPKHPNSTISRFRKYNTQTSYVHTSNDTEGSEYNSNKLQFDEFPVSIKFSSMNNLSKIIQPRGFKKLSLSLVYRRNQNCVEIGQADNLYNKSGLLALMRTKQGIEIGGYITAKLKKQLQDTKDQNSSIFNIEKQTILKVMENSASKAVIVGKDNLLNFSDDLVVPIECLAKKSHYRKQSYQPVQPQQREEQLGLPSQFEMESVEVYEVEESLMEMRI